MDGWDGILLRRLVQLEHLAVLIIEIWTTMKPHLYILRLQPTLIFEQKIAIGPAGKIQTLSSGKQLRHFIFQTAGWQMWTDRKTGGPHHVRVFYVILSQNLVLSRFLKGFYESHPALGVLSTKFSKLLKGFQQKSACFPSIVKKMFLS